MLWDSVVWEGKLVTCQIKQMVTEIKDELAPSQVSSQFRYKWIIGKLGPWVRKRCWGLHFRPSAKTVKERGKFKKGVNYNIKVRSEFQRGVRKWWLLM